MSELIQTRNAFKTTQRELLVTVSAFALLTICSASNAASQEADQPTVWIELGGQLERVDGGEEPYTPPFLSPVPTFLSESPLRLERPARYSYGAEGKIAFEPNGTDLLFSVGLRYGRSMANRHVHEQTPGLVIALPTGRTEHAYWQNHSDTVVRNSESHAILDFQAGKDVGLGIFGRGSTSTVNLGVRYAQFHARSNSHLQALEDASTGYKTFFQYLKYEYTHGAIHQSHMASAQISRSFRGIGPSLSWDASVPFAGRPDVSEFAFDWGINAAVLFGRQKVFVHHQSTVLYYSKHLLRDAVYSTVFKPGVEHLRSRAIVVPNIGGFAGLSLKFPSAKVSLGYRADFFFGAMDGGVDTRKTYDRSFYGPFAKISIGLGG
jgi:hypothetical protein